MGLFHCRVPFVGSVMVTYIAGAKPSLVCNRYRGELVAHVGRFEIILTAAGVW